MHVRTIESGSSANGRIGVFPKPQTNPEVGFGTGVADRATHVKLDEFDGPLALLLALIEARQVDVLTVPLGSLAEAYLDALATLDGDRLGSVSAFVAISAQLILIKSRAILPRPPKTPAIPLDDEPDPEAELRARLLEYKLFHDAGLAFGARPVGGRLFRRDAEIAAQAGRVGAIPPERPPLPPSVLAAALRRLARVIVDVPLPVEMVARAVTITERTAVIRDALRGSDAIVLQELLQGVRDRVVVAVTFLAMLELSKRREITVEQAEPWGPIIARRLVRADGAAIAADSETDESLESFA
jgi:segregation and condensation protein A